MAYYLQYPVTIQPVIVHKSHWRLSSTELNTTQGQNEAEQSKTWLSIPTSYDECNSRGGNWGFLLAFATNFWALRVISIAESNHH